MVKRSRVAFRKDDGVQGTETSETEPTDAAGGTFNLWYGAACGSELG